MDHVGNITVDDIEDTMLSLNGSDHLLLGCRVMEDVVEGEDVMDYSLDHASAMIDEVSIWRWRLRDQERPFFVGGHGEMGDIMFLFNKCLSTLCL